MLHEFIVENRDLIIERARQRVRQRTVSNPTGARLEHGIPLFLTQVADALAPDVHPVGTAISDSASLHGNELLENGFTVSQVVHGYGDVCQIVTELAGEKGALISTGEFQVFNRCLDDAIAGAVTAYGHQREANLAYEGVERLGVFAHELRNLLNTAVMSFDVMKRGIVGLSGSTSAIHARSLSGLCALVERSVAEIRLEAGAPLLESISVADLIEEVSVTAAMQAEGRGLHLTVESVESAVVVQADRQLLTSAVVNLLQNAFKFTRAHGGVSLTARVAADRVLIDVRDECGGLPPGKTDQLFQPFIQRGSNRSGLGLGLSIALAATHANAGELDVCDLPGDGCIFTISLPIQATA